MAWYRCKRSTIIFNMSLPVYTCCAYLNALSPEVRLIYLSPQKQTMDRNDLCVENNQKENVPSETPSPPHDITPVLEFSELKPSRFGISVQSFIPWATPKGERSATFGM